MNLSDTGIAVEIRSLENIEELYLRKNSQVHANMFYFLTSHLEYSVFQHLKVIDLWGTQITDDSLVALACATNLHTIILAHTAITNQGIGIVAQQFPKIRKLSLRR